MTVVYDMGFRGG